MSRATIVDRPSEPPGSGSEQRLKHRSYPCREAGGFVWVWLGDPASPAEFEPPAWAPSPDIRTSIVKIRVNCNWAQVLEGAIDSAHSSSLHASDMVPAQVAGAGANVEGVAAAVHRQGAPAAGAAYAVRIPLRRDTSPHRAR